MTLLSVDGASSINEAQLRNTETTLRLSLHGAVQWSSSARAGDLTGMRLSLQPAASLKLLRVAAPAPQELLLTLERHPVFDVPRDTPLTLHVTHTCQASMLLTAELVCAAAVLPAGSGDEAAAASTLTAAITVLSGGAPPGRPGRPYLQHVNSYGSLMVVWSPPEEEGDSPVSGYAWVEYVAGVPVLTGDAVPTSWAADNASLHAVMGGFRRGYGILPGALAAVNRGGYGEFSEPWPTATMGTPNEPAGVQATTIAASTAPFLSTAPFPFFLHRPSSTGISATLLSAGHHRPRRRAGGGVEAAYLGRRLPGPPLHPHVAPLEPV